MVEKMYKYSLVLHHQDFEEFLARLQDLGLMHISVEKSQVQDKEDSLYRILLRLDEVIGTLNRIQSVSPRKKELHESALRYVQKLGHTTPESLFSEHEQSRLDIMSLPILQFLRDKKAEERKLKRQGKDFGEIGAPYCVLSAYEAMHRVEDLLVEQDNTQQQIKKMYKDLEEAKIWGSFSPRVFSELYANRLKIHYFSISQKLYNAQWEQDYPIKQVSQEKGLVYFVYFQIEEEPMPVMDGVTEVQAPKYSHDYKKREIIILEAREQEILRELEDMYIYVSTLEQGKLEHLNQLSYKVNKEYAKLEAEDHIRIVEGFIPDSRKTEFDAFLKEEGVLCVESSAAEAAMAGENVPILLRNNPFSRLFEPITKLFALPSYMEADLTPMLAPFFMLFFGFCFGDAGYGILLFVGAWIMKGKVKPENKSFCTLAQFFGVAAVFFGLLSGSFFGITLAELDIMVRFKKYFFNSDNMMTLALVLGGVQILFGMLLQILKIIRLNGFKYAIGRISWFALIIFSLPVIGEAMQYYVLPDLIKYVLYGAMGLSLLGAFFYNNPEKNILFNFGSGLWNAYNVLTGLIGDLLSYIRLFALGLTGGILGGVFNSLAMDMSGNIPVVSSLIMLIILLIGHSINIALTTMGALVHPIRLTFVEFYKNAGFEGTGKAYEPFKVMKKEENN